jgi:hypothetical protein
MDNPLIIAGILFVLFDLAIVMLVLKKLRGRKISTNGKMRVDAAWLHVQSIGDPVRRLMEADKVEESGDTFFRYQRRVARSQTSKHPST